MNNKIQQFISEQPRENMLGIILILGLAIIAPFYGGWDYLVSIRGETLSRVFVHSYNPYPAYWFFYPFAILPATLGYIVWNLVNAAGFISALLYWRQNVLLFAITLPCFWNFYGGEYEGFFAGALVLALAANPWLAGFGIFVLTIKPQVGLLLILYALFQRKDWRLLVLPAALYLLSFAVHGWWIPAWLNHITTGFDHDLISNTNITLYPLGLLALLLLARYWKHLNIWILSGSLAMPYFPVYSLSTFFTINAPAVWFTIGLWAFYVIQDVIPGAQRLADFGFLIPIGMLAVEIWKIETSRGISSAPA